MGSLITWLENTDLADLIRENDLLFPLFESIHVLAVCLVVGSILVIDLRVLGLASQRQPAARVIRTILPVTWSAFAVAVLAGSMMFISNATHYLQNGWFIAKLLLLAAAGLNMLGFHFITARDLHVWGDRAHSPTAARISAGLSLALWVAIVVCGRWIGFTMTEGS